MKKLNYKLLGASCLVVSFMLFNTSQIQAKVGDTFTFDQLQYKVLTEKDSKGTVEVYGNGFVAGNVTIPSTIENNGNIYNVTSIGYHAFFECTDLTSVTIGNNVSSIKTQAFYSCRSLTNIIMPDSLISIEQGAFNGCRRLGNVKIPNSVTSIGVSVFGGCTNLTSINIPDGITSISGSAFTQTSLTNIIIPDSVTEIGVHAFSYCNNLTNVIIPDSVTLIRATAFSQCSHLTSITIPGCKNSINGTVIATSAFLECDSLENATIGDYVTSIENSVFSDCPNLIRVVMGNRVSSIGKDVFSDCNRLTSVYYRGDVPKNVDSGIYNNTLSTLISYYPEGNSTWEDKIVNGKWQKRQALPWSIPSLSGISISGLDSINVGSTATYICTAIYSDGSSNDVIPNWSVNPISMASITSEGVLTGIAAGTVTVMAIHEDKTATKNVTVNEVVVKPTITTQPKSQTVNEGESVTFIVGATSGSEINEDKVVPLSSSVNLDMVWIEPGSFTMGSPDGELGRRDNETLHQVAITEGYWLGKYEVTQEQYQTVMESNPSKFNGNRLPVEKVTWANAMEFCARLTEQEKAAGRLPAGYEYTLPTEAQWEYACRAGTTTELNSGKNLTSEENCPNMDQVGWYVSNSDSTTKIVGQKQPNAWGLYDMHGNVWEWCLDWRGDYSASMVIDPVGPNNGTYKILRGGSWNYTAGYCRSAVRGGTETTKSNSYTGFRVALSAIEKGKDLVYQWYKDGKAISGATSVSYTISSAKTSDAGSYTVTVSNGAGSVTSNVATLTVNKLEPDGTAARSIRVDGLTATVSLKLTPNDAVNVCFIEETVPAIGTIIPNDGGVYTASKNVIRWSFLDSIPREVSYTVTVSNNLNEIVYVSGEVAFDTTVKAIEGETVLDFTVKTHPADTNDDFEISMLEVSAYAVAWKQGKSWSREPVDIPMNYVARGALIWINGGDYIYDSSKAKPACWVNAVKAAAVELAFASVPERKINVANGKANVAIEIVPEEEISVYFVEEQLPADVTLNVTDISEGGNYIAGKNVIRWSFLDGEARTLTYTIEPEPGFKGTLTLSGEVMLDEETFTIEGDSKAIFSPAINFVVEDDGETLVLDFEGILYESDDAINWRIVEGAKPPFTVDTSKGKKFYRSVK